MAHYELDGWVRLERGRGSSKDHWGGRALGSFWRLFRCGPSGTGGGGGRGRGEGAALGVGVGESMAHLILHWQSRSLFYPYFPISFSS